MRCLPSGSRRGQLPVGAFGELMREKLDAPMAEMFETYLEEIGRCPTVLPDEAFLWPEQPSVSPPAVCSAPDPKKTGSAQTFPPPDSPNRHPHTHTHPTGHQAFGPVDPPPGGR